MPTYEYECSKCGERFDVFQTFAEEALKKHPGACKGKVVKVMSPAGIVFSGSGFYKTDSRDTSRSRAKSKSGPETKGGSESNSSTTTDSLGGSSESAANGKTDSASSKKPAASGATTPST